MTPRDTARWVRTVFILKPCTLWCVTSGSRPTPRPPNSGRRRSRVSTVWGRPAAAPAPALPAPGRARANSDALAPGQLLPGHRGACEPLCRRHGQVQLRQARVKLPPRRVARRRPQRFVERLEGALCWRLAERRHAKQVRRVLAGRKGRVRDVSWTCPHGSTTPRPSRAAPPSRAVTASTPTPRRRMGRSTLASETRRLAIPRRRIDRGTV